MNRVTSILPDLAEVRIPEEVKMKANLVFQNLQITTKRKNNRQRMIFFCVYAAYLQLGLTEEPRVIAELVSLPRNEIPKAFSLCSELQTGFHLPVRNKEAKDFFPVILRELRLDIPVEELEDILDYVLEKDPSLREEFPQTLSAAVVYYYLEINGFNVSRKEISTVVRRSEISIVKICKRLIIAHNM